MRRLSGLDAAFLALETPHSAGHVASVSILDPTTAPDGLDLEDLRRVIGSRLSSLPVLRQRLVTVPWGLDHPVWADDRDFDLTYHVRELALPAPGTMDLLTTQVARLHSRPLDRDRPLWETYLISGLEKGRVALYTKVHHAAIDGATGAELLTVLFDLSPQGRPDPPAPSVTTRPAPSRAVLGVRAVGRLAVQPWRGTRLLAEAVGAIPRVLPAAVPFVAPVLGSASAALASVGAPRADAELVAAAPFAAPPTMLNEPISAHRVCAFRAVSLPQVKAVKNALGCSVNDVVMAMCAGALRTWLDEHSALPADPLVAMIPVNIRTDDPSPQAGGGNQVSAMLAVLPTHLGEATDRVRATRRTTAIAKKQLAHVPQGLVDDAIDFAPPAFVTQAARLYFATKTYTRMPAFNVVISNVPGPNIPIYLAGATLEAHYPLSVVTDGLALNITLIGYRDRLHFGLVGDRQITPDLEHLCDLLEAELAELVTAAETVDAS